MTTVNSAVFAPMPSASVSTAMIAKPGDLHSTRQPNLTSPRIESSAGKRHASRLVSRLTRYLVPPNKAIVGANAFAHEAGIHQDGLLKDVSTYQIMDPDELGFSMSLPLGKHSGRHAFARACVESGIELDRDELTAAFRRFKELADEGRSVSLLDVFEEVPVSCMRSATQLRAWRGTGPGRR